MRSRTLLALSVIAAAVVLSCDLTPDQYQGEPNIYAVLCADSLQARVMVGRTVSVDDTLKQAVAYDTFWYDGMIVVHQYMVFPWRGVSEADVLLKQGQQSFVLIENPDSAGYYNTDFIQSSPGQTWELEVTYPTGEEIEAQTTIPGSFEIAGMLTDTVKYGDTLRWSKSDNAAGYLYSSFIWTSWEDVFEDTTYIDSAFTYPELLPGDRYFMPLGGLYWIDSLWFWVAALDTNAYDYYYYYYQYNNWGDLLLEDYMHIPGAWGVFGAQTAVRSRTYIIQPDTTYPSH